MQIKERENVDISDLTENLLIKRERIRSDLAVEIILMIKRNKKLLFFTGLFSFFLTLVILRIFYIQYESSVTFYIDDSIQPENTASEPEQYVLSQLNSISKNRMNLLLYSDEMAERLEKQLDLSGHYFIDKNNPEFLSLIHSKLESNISYKKDLFNKVIITVSDDNQNFPPRLANAIFENLVEMNMERVHKNLRYKLSVYNTNIRKFETQKENDINRFIQTLSAVDKLNSPDLSKSNELVFLKRDLSNLFTEYKNSSELLNKNELIYQLTSDVIRDSTIQSLFLLNKAFPSSLKSKYGWALGWSFAVSVFSVIYLLFSIYLYSKYKPYLQLFFKRDKPYFHI